MLPIIHSASRSWILRGVASALTHASVSRRRLSRNTLHSCSETVPRFQLAVQSAPFHGVSVPAAQPLRMESPYRMWSVCAAIGAPPNADVDAAAAETLSSDAS